MSTVAVARGPLVRRPEFRFPVRFLAVVTALAVGWAVLEPTSPWLCSVTAQSVAWFSRLFGLHAVVEPGAHVRFEDGGAAFRYLIADECTATLLVATYAAAVIAYPADRRSWALGLGVGVPVLLAANLVRLVTLGWTGVHAPAAFDAVHRFWWQAFYVAGTGVVWFAWAWWTSDARTILGSRSTGARREWASRAALVSGVLLASAVLGLWGHAADLYFRLIGLVLGPLAHVLWGGKVQLGAADEGNTFVTFSGVYALLAALVALFLASPGVDLRTRLRGVVRWALPSAFVMAVAEGVVTATVRVQSSTPGASSLWPLVGRVLPSFVFAFHIGVSLVVWHLWLQRARRRQERRLAKVASRTSGRRRR